MTQQTPCGSDGKPLFEVVADFDLTEDELGDTDYDDDYDPLEWYDHDFEVWDDDEEDE